MIDVHWIDCWLAVIEPESGMIAVRWTVGWFVLLPDAFALAVPPGAVTRTLVRSCNQPPEAWHLSLFINLPVVLEALTQLVGERVGNGASD